MEEKGRVLELYSSLAQADRGAGSGGDEGGNKVTALYSSGVLRRADGSTCVAS